MNDEFAITLSPIPKIGLRRAAMLAAQSLNLRVPSQIELAFNF